MQSNNFSTRDEVISGIIHFCDEFYTNDSKYQAALTQLQCQNQIIDNLGGLPSIIKLCLTNPRSINTINDKKLENINQILSLAKHNIDHTAVSTQIPIANPIANSNINCNHLTVSNTNFYANSIIMEVDSTDNLYFKLFFSHNINIAKFICDKILYNKWYIIIMISLAFICVLGSSIYGNLVTATQVVLLSVGWCN